MVDKATNLLWIDLDISAAGKKLPSVDSYRAFVLALLQNVLENSLGNAWKFTSKRASACIESGQVHLNGTSTYFVRDNGAGFDQAHSQRLFGAFQRLHTGSEFPGSGVGLATVQRIIHRHGGRIWAGARSTRVRLSISRWPKRIRRGVAY
jgi:light-regulated signal transduction histidine kinase (bacteriophytochrome)